MWDKLNVWQYQNLIKSLQSGKKDKDLTTTHIAICHNMTENQVDSLSLEEYSKLEKSVQFLNEPMPQVKPKKYLKVNGKKYKFVYDVRRMPFARYIESKHFAEDLIGNLHKLGATMVLPMKKSIFGWVEDKYDASKHSQYADDILEANILDIYGSLVFFYQVYRNWMEVSKDYLIQQVMKKENKTIEEATFQIQAFLDILDGSIPPNLLPSTKIAKLRKHIN